jgi:hypothetical protein
MSDEIQKNILTEICARHEQDQRWRNGPSMICPHAHDDRGWLLSEIERLRARVAVLEGLLAPLSAEADKHDPPDGDDDHLAWGSVLTIGHLREARAALEAKP